MCVIQVKYICMESGGWGQWISLEGWHWSSLGDGGRSGHTTLSLTPPESAQLSIALPRKLTAQQGVSSWWGVNLSLEGGAIAFLRLRPKGDKCSTQERWYMWCGRGAKHRGPGNCPFSCLPESETSASPHMISACSALSLPGPRVSSCK